MSSTSMQPLTIFKVTWQWSIFDYTAVVIAKDTAHALVDLGIQDAAVNVVSAGIGTADYCYRETRTICCSAQQKRHALQNSPEDRQPVRLADGSLENFTLKVAGKGFTCICKCNVFHKPDIRDLELYKCNSCGTEYT